MGNALGDSAPEPESAISPRPGCDGATLGELVSAPLSHRAAELLDVNNDFLNEFCEFCKSQCHRNRREGWEGAVCVTSTGNGEEGSARPRGAGQWWGKVQCTSASSP